MRFIKNSRFRWFVVFGADGILNLGNEMSSMNCYFLFEGFRGIADKTFIGNVRANFNAATSTQFNSCYLCPFIADQKTV